MTLRQVFVTQNVHRFDKIQLRRCRSHWVCVTVKRERERAKKSFHVCAISRYFSIFRPTFAIISPVMIPRVAVLKVHETPGRSPSVSVAENSTSSDYPRGSEETSGQVLCAI